MAQESALLKLPKSFTQADLLRAIEQAAQEAAKKTAAAIEEVNKRNARRSDPGKAAQRMLADYRRLKIAQKEDIQISDEEGLEMRWRYLEDLMGTPDHAIVTENTVYIREKKLQYNHYKIQQIEAAMDMYRRECENSGNEEAMRRYRVMQMRYMGDKACSVEEIADIECVSKNTVYHDLDLACKVIAVYLSAI